MSFLEAAKTQYEDLVARAGAAAAGSAEKRFREFAWAESLRMGLPDRRTETWKYSNLNSIVARDWPLAEEASAAVPARVGELIAQWRDRFDVAVLVDGVFRPETSVLSGGYAVRAARDWAMGSEYEDGWTALSAAVARAGVEIEVPEGAVVARPLLVIHAQASGGRWSSAQHRVVLGARSEFRLAEVHVGDGLEYVRSDLVSVKLADGARLEWTRVQWDDLSARHFSAVDADVAASAQLSFLQLHCGAQWTRSSVRASLRGSGADVSCSGLLFGSGQRHLDQRVELKHLAAHTSSAQLFKSILKDRARGVLNGKIYIARDAQKVSSSQYNHSLLIGSGAEIDTKPELEIYADDVKANHGASVGRLDDDKIFYLMSRAIPRAEAQAMLSQAFVGDVLMKLTSRELRSFASAQVRDLLPSFIGGGA